MTAKDLLASKIPAHVLVRVYADVRSHLVNRCIPASSTIVAKVVGKYLEARSPEVGWMVALVERGTLSPTDLDAISRNVASRLRPIHYRDPTADTAIRNLEGLRGDTTD